MFLFNIITVYVCFSVCFAEVRDSDHEFGSEFGWHSVACDQQFVVGWKCGVGGQVFIGCYELNVYRLCDVVEFRPLVATNRVGVANPEPKWKTDDTPDQMKVSHFWVTQAILFLLGIAFGYFQIPMRIHRWLFPDKFLDEYVLGRANERFRSLGTNEKDNQ